MAQRLGLIGRRSGEVVFDGEDVTNHPPYEIVRRGLGYAAAGASHGNRRRVGWVGWAWFAQAAIFSKLRHPRLLYNEVAFGSCFPLRSNKRGAA